MTSLNDLLKRLHSFQLLITNHSVFPFQLFIYYLNLLAWDVILIGFEYWFFTYCKRKKLATLKILMEKE